MSIYALDLKRISASIVCSTETKIYHLESESRGEDNDDEAGTRLYHERVNLFLVMKTYSPAQINLLELVQSSIIFKNCQNKF